MKQRVIRGRVPGRLGAGVALWLMLACGGGALADQPADIAEFLPQGRVSGVEAVQLRFSAAATAFGDASAVPPVRLSCEGPAPQGQGRWLDDTRWTYVFDQTLPAGVRCAATANPDFRDLNGRALAADQSYVFDTGAPAVKDVRPYRGKVVDEEQVFILGFDAPVDPQHVLERSHCRVEGLAEKIPVLAVSDEHRLPLMQASYFPPPEDAAHVVLLQCARALPPDTRVRLEVGPGIRAIDQPVELAGSDKPMLFDYPVRPPFMATLSCTRERAGRPCLPITPISVSFSSPVRRAAVDDVRLSAGDAVFAPTPSEEDGEYISQLSFAGPFPPNAALRMDLPADLRDDAGRALENAGRFPMQVETADYPPLAKFASGSFGVVERFAHGAPASGTEEQAAVPVTLRHVEAEPNLRGLTWSAGRVASLRSMDDGEVLRWYGRLQRLEAGLWREAELEDILAGRKPRPVQNYDAPLVDVRSVSLLKNQSGVQRLALPASEQDLRPFEVVGVPLQDPGFHVLEIESPRLGASLLEDGGAMYVRTGVLLTNLSVHLKQGRDDLLVWVTTLADAKPVVDAEITVLDCQGRQLLKGRSDAQGLWRHPEAVEAPTYCDASGLSGLFVSARLAAEHPQAHGKADYAFVMSDWNRGLETWRFNVPTAYGDRPKRLWHTVFDRSLFRAGETVSMKHFLRDETRDGLGLPVGALPDRLLITHQGSEQSHELPVQWAQTPSGGLAALNEFEIPESAHLGEYSVRLTDADRGWFGSRRFRIEEFRLPLLEGQLSVRSGPEGRPGALVAPERLAVDMQLGWLSGGAASGQKVALSAMAEGRGVRMAGFDDYSFRAPPEPQRSHNNADSWADEESLPSRRVFLDGEPLVLDANGTATMEVGAVPAVEQPQRFVFEAEFADPNGEVQTLSQAVDVWPAALQAGLRVESWKRAGQDISVSLIALGLDAQPLPGVKMHLQAAENKTYTVRKRMVGGFYRYDTHNEHRDIGTLCNGETDATGKLECTIRFDQSGTFDLLAVAEDAQGRTSRAFTSMWVSGAGESWFGGADDDRIDLIPAKREWVVGEEAEFQVRMPFREALALVSVEREGVLWTDLVTLKGSEPLIRVPVQASWGPNAFVSVLVLRGRVYELPWQSFFDWGWRSPKAWLQARREQAGGGLLSSTVDLAKPAFRLGLAELKLSGQADRLQVAVLPDQDTLQVREEGSARVKVSLPDGSPAAHGTVAFALVDEALLELSPNDSWALYEAMHPRRSLAVETATSQLEVVGRRHYGRKAVAAGGGGGNVPTRQLFDTLLSWQPMVKLDENGEAQVRYRMNDALSRFRLVVLADHGAAHFGSATASVATRQDLQLVSGLPPTVREGDRYQAVATVRNGTDEARHISVSLVQDTEGAQLNLPEQTLALAAGASGSVSWEVLAPQLEWPADGSVVNWRFQATDGSVADALSVTQRVEPRLPLSTVQAGLLGLAAGESIELPIQAPSLAQRRADGAAQGGIALDVSASLAGSLEGVREWWLAYPYTCLEQSASQAMALDDVERWRKVVERLSTHMDEDGLLRYFPGTGPGSDVLTAYLVSGSNDAGRLGLESGIPDAELQRMLDGLQAFAQGRISRDRYLTGADLDARRLHAMEALARYGRVSPGMLDSLAATPSHWSTPTLVDWLSVWTRLPQGPERRQALAQARSLLVSRMTVSGGAMVFSDVPLNGAPELMASRATSQAKLMLLVMDAPQWQRDLPLMAQGLLGLQRQGAWAMTTENLLGSLALASFAQRFETDPVSGMLRAELANDKAEIVLPEAGASVTRRLDWPAGQAPLLLSHEGEGRAWVGMRAQARMEPAQAQEAGYRIERRVVPVQRSREDGWSRGDIYRVEIDIHSRDSANWVVLNDPVPSGAAILGSGLGRDRQVERPHSEFLYSPAFIERTASTYRAYFDYLPAGRVSISYSVRLNAVGDFGLPPTRVEALYRPDLYGVFPNAEGMRVGAGSFDAAGTLQ